MIQFVQDKTALLGSFQVGSDVKVEWQLARKVDKILKEK
jgi:hypothetical protein